MNFNELRLFDILPNTLQNDINIVSIVESVQPELNNLTQCINEVLLIPNVSSKTGEILNLLALHFHIDSKGEGWSNSLKDSEKIGLIENAIQLHKIKGTKRAITRVFEILNLTTEIAEWYEYNGAPYSFRIIVDVERDFDETLQDLIITLVNEYKNVRSEFVVILRVKIPIITNIVTFAQTHETVIINPMFDNWEMLTPTKITTFNTTAESVTIKPKPVDSLELPITAYTPTTPVMLENAIISPLEQGKITLTSQFGLLATNIILENGTVNPLANFIYPARAVFITTTQNVEVTTIKP